MKVRIKSILSALVAALAVICLFGACGVPQADEAQQIAKKDPLSGSQDMSAVGSKGIFRTNIKCRWDAGTGEPQYLLAKKVNNQWRLTFGPMRRDGENEVYNLKNQWLIIPYDNNGRYFIQCVDSRLYDGVYSCYLGGGYFTPGVEESQPYYFSSRATLRKIRNFEDANIRQGGYIPPVSSCKSWHYEWADGEDMYSNTCLLWYYDENGFNSGEERLWLDQSGSMFVGSANDMSLGVLNIENRHADWWLSQQNGFMTDVGVGYNGSLPFNGDYSWYWYYWSNWWGFVQM